MSWKSIKEIFRPPYIGDVATCEACGKVSKKTDMFFSDDVYFCDEDEAFLSKNNRAHDV